MKYFEKKKIYIYNYYKYNEIFWKKKKKKNKN